MKKLLLGFILITGCTVNAQQKGTIVYDDNVEVRQVPNFTAIKVSSAIDLYLTQSNEIKVAVSASNDEIRGRVITEVQGGTLIIKLEENGIIVNANTIPHDTSGPFKPSGIRIGTPAMTTLGWKEKEFEEIGQKIGKIIME